MPTSIETPRGAVEEIIEALNARDYDRLRTRIDLKSFVDYGYDDAIEQLALNCDEFHKKYPHDLLFQFGAQAIRVYNAIFRGVHLRLIFGIIDGYFKNDFAEPPSFSVDPVGNVSYHFSRLAAALRAEVVEEESDAVTVEVTAVDNFKNLIGTLRIKLETAQVDEHWRVIKIKNADELVRPIVDIAERVWPREWDRGVNL